MISIVIFSFPGLAIITLIGTKRIEERRKKPIFISKAISKGDTYVRDIFHTLVHIYSDGKETLGFLYQKQIPIHSRNYLNKILAFLKERREKYMENMRDSKLLNKSEGISEFFKNMSQVEKGNGEVHDIYEDSSQENKKEVD